MEKERRPSDVNIGFNPLEDPQFADTIQDFLTLYSPSELEQEPFIQTYLIELLARWGRWHSRGRAPALCFEAACVGGLSFLNKTNRQPTELTARADASLARILAGLVIDEVEPMARQQGGAVRDKAVGIVADEFLARAVSPRVAKVFLINKSAKKRMKKRKTVIKMPLVQEARPVVGARRPSIPNNTYIQQPGGRPEYVNPMVAQPPGPSAYYQETQYNPRFQRKNSQDSEYPPQSRRVRQQSAPEVDPNADPRYFQRGRTGSAEPPVDDPRYFQRNRSGSNEGGYITFDRRPSVDTNTRLPAFYGSAPSILDSNPDEFKLNPKPRKDSLPDTYPDTLPYRSRSGSIDRGAGKPDIFVDRFGVRRVRPQGNLQQPIRRYDPRDDPRYQEGLDQRDNRGYPVRPIVKPVPNFPGREIPFSKSEPTSPSQPPFLGAPFQSFTHQRRPSQEYARPPNQSQLYRPPNDPNSYGDPFARRPSNDDGRRKPTQEYPPRSKTPNIIDPPRSKTPTTSRLDQPLRENSMSRRGGEGLNNLLQSVLAECEDYIDKLDMKKPK